MALRSSVVIGCGTVALLSLLTLVAQESPRILIENFQPIATRLLPTDKVVIVRPRANFDERAFNPYPNVGIELAELRYIDEILVVRRVEQKPSLAGNGSWITTHLRATVTQVLKTGALLLVPGMAVECELDGGEMLINGVTVRAGLNPSFDRPQYLIGVRFHPDLKVWQLVKLFEVDDNARLAPLRSLTGVQASSSLLYGMKLDDVALSLSKQ